MTVIDTNDLPIPVCKAVDDFASLPPRIVAVLLRHEARVRIGAALTYLEEEGWAGSALEMLALASGYVTASARLDQAGP